MPSQIELKQRKYFEKADEKRFCWRTENLLISSMEYELLKILVNHPSGRILEVGSGEGHDIVNLRKMKEFGDKIFGVDYSFEKIKFAARNAEGIFVCGDARNLPFKKNSFSLVFSKDLLHHLEEKREVIREMVRVCSSGIVVVIEANGRNYLMNLFGTLIIEERGVKDINSITLKEWCVSDTVSNIHLIEAQPFPLPRLLFHYRFGLEILGRQRRVCNFFSRLQEVCKKLISPERWGYIYVILEKE